MGNNSSNVDLQQCRLSKQEFLGLRRGDKFDHRDSGGLFAEAVILKKRGFDAEIHYKGYSDKYDTTVSYQQAPHDFAKHKSVSQRQAQSSLRDIKVGEYISFRPDPSDPNAKWKKAKITQRCDESGQVFVAYKNSKNHTKKRWTHLDNVLEVKPLESNAASQTQPGSRAQNNNRPQNNHKQYHKQYNKQYNAYNNHNNHNNQYQMQQQAQIQRQDQMTVRTQLLLDDTNKQIQLIRNYLDAAAKEIDADELSMCNQKVVLGLTCFQMKVSGMRKNGEKEGLDFGDAFKSSAMIIKQFSAKYKQQFGDNEYLMNRLKPCLNYMHAVLKGKENLPSLPYVNEYKFNKEVASSVVSQVNYAQNHVIPDRINDINKNSQQYKKEQAQLKEQYENQQDDEKDDDGDDNMDGNINFNHLIQDYNTKNIAFAKSKKEQDAIIAAQQHQYKYQEPDLQNMDLD